MNVIFWIWIACFMFTIGLCAGDDDPWWALTLCVFFWPCIIGKFLRETVFKQFLEEDE